MRRRKLFDATLSVRYGYVTSEGEYLTWRFLYYGTAYHYATVGMTATPIGRWLRHCSALTHLVYEILCSCTNIQVQSVARLKAMGTAICGRSSAISKRYLRSDRPRSIKGFPVVHEEITE